ncbi:hypothetical protein FKP32DRAFT_267593 [Trametes sanguinea]|nr:hypothetical protein FKP32DRAFT_267593 [Trametes sanguinea]
MECRSGVASQLRVRETAVPFRRPYLPNGRAIPGAEGMGIGSSGEWMVGIRWGGRRQHRGRGSGVAMDAAVYAGSFDLSLLHPHCFSSPRRSIFWSSSDDGTSFFVLSCSSSGWYSIPCTSPPVLLPHRSTAWSDDEPPSSSQSVHRTSESALIRVYLDNLCAFACCSM